MKIKIIGWFAIFFLVIVSCENISNDAPKNIKEIQDIDVLKKYAHFQKIAVITENGCVTCNESMAKQLDKLIGDSTIAIVVEASGVKIDVSHLIEKKEYDNVFIDISSELSKYFNQVDNSFIIDMTKDKLEIVPIDTKNISDLNSLILQ